MLSKMDMREIYLVKSNAGNINAVIRKENDHYLGTVDCFQKITVMSDSAVNCLKLLKFGYEFQLKQWLKLQLLGTHVICEE